jgi:hypothetical protein
MKKLFLVLLPLIALLSAGCPSKTIYPVSEPYWTSPGWRATTVTALYFDYKEDLDFDYEWPEEIPQETRDSLESRAIYLYENQKGI